MFGNTHIYICTDIFFPSIQSSLFKGYQRRKEDSDRFAYVFSGGNPMVFFVVGSTIIHLAGGFSSHIPTRVEKSQKFICPFLVRTTSKLCFCLQILKMYNVFSMILPVFHVSPMFQRLKFQYLHKSSDTLSSHRIPM